MPLSEYVPQYLLEYKEFVEIYQTQGTETDDLNRAIDDILDQCSVDTATWGLKFWENFLGLPVDEGKPIDFRRSSIKAKLRGSGTITVSLLKNVAESFSNGEVEVTENIAPFTFQVNFVGTRGTPPNMDDLKRAIDDIKPAHLAVVYKFRFTIHSELKNKTHAQLSLFTHKQIREGATLSG